MDDPITLSVTVFTPIIDAGRRFDGGEHVAFTASGKSYLIVEIPNNPGRWLGHFTDGAVVARSHSSDETVSMLIRMASEPPRPPAAGARRRRWWRKLG